MVSATAKSAADNNPQALEKSQRPGMLNPADGSALESIKWATPKDVEDAVMAARGAQEEWAARTLPQRERHIIAFGRALLEFREEGIGIMASETGRSRTLAHMSDLASVGDFAKGVVKTGRKTLLPEKVKFSALDYPGKSAVVEAVPRGVVGIIAPWNYPVGNMMKSVLPALLAGNAVVIKPSEHTPRSADWFMRVANKVFPRNLVKVVQGDGAIGQALIDAPIDSLVFTGSVPTGRKVMVAAAEKMIPCSAELGSKDAALVLADCNFERTVAGIAQWSFFVTGQDCSSVERIFVHESIADRFVERLGKMTDQLRVHDGTGEADIAPLQNPGQLEKVKDHVADALEKGATLISGGEETGSGFGFRPTVLDHCKKGMKVIDEETFGPVAAIIRFSDVDKAVEEVNDCDYGLSASVWTSDMEKGAAIARRFHTGVTYVNNHSIAGIHAEIPWTGTRGTGTGVANSHHAYDSFVRRRSVISDRNQKPDPWWLPVTSDLAPFADALARKQLGSLGAMLQLGGLLGKRIKSIQAWAKGE